MRRSRSLPRRDAFTLTEILVVVAIIAILVAIGAGAYVRVMSAQQESRSEDAVRIVAKNYVDQWNWVKTAAEKETISNFPALLSLASGVQGNSNGDPARAMVLLKIFRMTEAFPQNYAEIQNPFSTTASVQNATIYGNSAVTSSPWLPTRYNLATYNTKLANSSKLSANINTTQSAACLFLALTQVNRGGSLRLSDEQLPANVKDSDQDGITEFIDNYGKPFVFIRFPIGSAATNGVTTISPLIAAEFAVTPSAKTGFGDPLDPDGLLQQPVLDPATKKQVAWWKAAYVTTPTLITNGQLLANLCSHPFPAAPAAPQPYYVPFLTSTGADKIYGPNPVGSESCDDIISYKLK